MGDDSSEESPRGELGNQPTEGIAISEQVLELDHVYQALAHPRRRYLCYALSEQEQWSLTELAETIAAWENGIPQDAVTSAQWEKMYLSLYHCHVPRLVEDGVVTFDERSETITSAENTDQVLDGLVGMEAALSH